MKVDREGLSDAQVLVALYNASQAGGMGLFQARDGEMTVEQAQRILEGERNEPRQPKRGTYFDYLYGRCLKTDVAEQPLDVRLFDRDWGSGAGQRAIDGAFDLATRPS